MSNPVKVARSILLAVILVAGLTRDSRAQSEPKAWQWNANGNVFAGANYQYRRAADITEFESQNWLMATGDRRFRTGTLMLHAMLSFEPYTLPIC